MADWVKHLKSWDYKIPDRRAVKAFTAGTVTYEPTAIVEDGLKRGAVEVTEKPGGDGKRSKP